MKRINIIISLIVLLIAGCVGMNPNSGERTVEYNFGSGDYDKALKVLYRNAEGGEPWAQCRLGGLYEVGDVITQDFDRARVWYLRAAVQTKNSRWAKGKELFSLGNNGWYGQNLYAYTAQAYLGEMLFKGKGISVDRVQAYLWLNHAFEGIIIDTGERIPPENESILASLKSSLTNEEWEQIKKEEINWSPIESDLYKTYANRLLE